MERIEYLNQYGISSKLVRILRGIYDKACIQVKLNGNLSSPIEASEEILQDSYRDVLMLLYADDICLLLEIDARKTLSVLHFYCQANKLTLNVEKTKILTFHRGRKCTISNGFFMMKGKLAYPFYRLESLE